MICLSNTAAALVFLPGPQRSAPRTGGLWDWPGSIVKQEIEGKRFVKLTLSAPHTEIVCAMYGFLIVPVHWNPLRLVCHIVLLVIRFWVGLVGLGHLVQRIMHNGMHVVPGTVRMYGVRVVPSLM